VVGEALAPPAVEDAQVEPTVDRHLLPARAARLEGTPRIVEPEIDALDHVARDLDIVVLEEDDATAELAPLADRLHLLEEALSFRILGMGLPGEDDLHGPLRRAEDLH